MDERQAGNSLLVSVIIPVFNGAEFLGESIESVLRQPHRPLEIIVVDDGSTDDSKQVAISYGPAIRYIRQENRGPSAACNQGLAIARGEMIGFIDADDLWTPNRLQLQLARLAQEPAVDIVMGHTQLMRLEHNQAGAAVYREMSWPWVMISPQCALFRRAVFDKVGNFDETMRFCEDVDWFLRAKEMGISIGTIPEITQYYRRHGGNVTNGTEQTRHGFMVALKKSLDRRRQTPTEAAAPLNEWFEAPGAGDGDVRLRLPE